MMAALLAQLADLRSRQLDDLSCEPAAEPGERREREAGFGDAVARCVPRNVDHADVEPRNVGASHLCFLVDDLPAFYEQLRQNGVASFVSPPVEVDTGINTGGYALYVRDPDGIMVELFQPPAGRT